MKKSDNLIVVKCSKKEDVIEKAKQAGINIYWVIIEISEEAYNEYKGIKIEIP